MNGSTSPADRGQELPEATGKCCICGKRRVLGDMIDHVKGHLPAAPDASRMDKDALILFPKTREEASCTWLLAQVRGGATLSDLVMFLEDEWFKQRKGRQVSITGPAAGFARAPFDLAATVSDLFSRESVLRLKTDTEYRVHVQHVGEVSCHAAARPTSIVAETFVAPSLPFEALDGKNPRTIRTIPATPPCGAGGEPGGLSYRAPRASIPATSPLGGGPASERQLRRDHAAARPRGVGPDRIGTPSGREGTRLGRTTSPVDQDLAGLPWRTGHSDLPARPDAAPCRPVGLSACRPALPACHAHSCASCTDMADPGRQRLPAQECTQGPPHWARRRYARACLRLLPKHDDDTVAETRRGRT